MGFKKIYTRKNYFFAQNKKIDAFNGKKLLKCKKKFTLNLMAVR